MGRCVGNAKVMAGQKPLQVHLDALRKAGRVVRSRRKHRRATGNASRLLRQPPLRQRRTRQYQ